MKQRRTASAIGYDPQDSGPRLLARGQGNKADQIVALAREAGVEVIEDMSLAAMLDAGARTGDIIPVWCWEAAAKLLAFVAARERKGSRQAQESGPGPGVGSHVWRKSEGYSS
ncbi:MAG: EscU/YscU/HrcU family type III secretion system export apparatus switch protein [Treponema sp.]|jgi:flagellar biosynthesis protein|nr:EscU/YscU/HrcU family type III secretion system export apparatus switch protein [Treponema sp.]